MTQTIKNTIEKPNLVGSIIYKIKELRVSGWNKREIDYKYIEASWNGLDYTSVKITGSRQDLLN